MSTQEQQQEATNTKNVQQQQENCIESEHSLSSSTSSSASSTSSASHSFSLIKLDELSSFGATKQSRLPALIKLNNPLSDLNSRHEQMDATVQAPALNSMPDFSASQLEKTVANGTGAEQRQQQQSLPANLSSSSDKKQDDSGDFHVVQMDDDDDDEESAPPVIGPSLPQPTSGPTAGDKNSISLMSQLQQSLGAPYASHLGDSLIEMIINLRNENQNLVRALETNNEYVKERLQEFKRCQEDLKRRELEHANEKAEHEHQVRKLQRQNNVLSERLKSMEAKLKEMKLEVSESLQAAHSSKNSSIQGDHEHANTRNQQLYPDLMSPESELFENSALFNSQQQQAATTMQMDATNGELLNQGDTTSEQQQQQPVVPDAIAVGAMTKEELSKRFDANKAQFYALADDPMRQCDQLEQQLNDIGKRDYEICLLQQQLNIYRQDFRLERMAKLEARIQIEKLKNDIDRLCLERLQEQKREENNQQDDDATHMPQTASHRHHDNLIGKLGHHLGKKAVKSAAKAAKYAAKQAHLEEKAAAALARAAAAKAAASSHFQQATATARSQTAPTAGGSATMNNEQQQVPQQGADLHSHSHYSRRNARAHRQHQRSSAGPSVRSEVMNDLLTTANKAMLTGYKMASTHVNLALDKLSQFEQQQASHLDANKHKQQQQQSTGKTMGEPSAPPMDAPSID